MLGNQDIRCHSEREILAESIREVCIKKSDHLHNSVDSRLVWNMTCAHIRYYEELEDAKKKCKAKRAKLELAKEKAQSKKDRKELNVNAA